MDDKELRELQNADSWDYEHAQRRPRIRKPRAVVSVAFSREDFERVAEHAQRLGMRTSELIRQAALDLAQNTGGQAEVIFASSGLGSVIYSTKMPPVTVVNGKPVFNSQQSLLLTA